MTPMPKRRTPQKLLQSLERQRKKEHPPKGYLKIFLGFAAGVGKTFKMLEKAQLLKRNGHEVVIGIVETHGRKETEALTQDLEVIPLRQTAYEGFTMRELDLDAVLRRKPGYVLVDELAHTNVPGSRHEKRFQDIGEILKAGINVYTTLNIQHVEGLHDIVKQITGVDVQETVPDRVLEEAEEIEVVDLPPDDLLVRLKQGKVYIPERAKEAELHFFTQGNLLALRELALRSASQHASDEMHDYLEEHEITGPWDASSRILVCIDTAPASAKLLRIGHRLAKSLNAEWFAVHVDLPPSVRDGVEAKLKLEQNLELARELGATVVRVAGMSIADEVATVAKDRNISLIIVGHSKRPLIARLLGASVVTKIIRKSSPAQVLVTDDAGPDVTSVIPRGRVIRDVAFSPRSILACIVGLAVTSGLCVLLRPFLNTLDLAMIFLLYVAGSAIITDMWTGIAFAALAVTAFDLFVIPPYFSFSAADIQYIPGFAVMFLVGVTINVLAERVQLQAQASREREAFMSHLADFSQTLLKAHTFAEVLGSATRSIGELFDCDAVFLLPDSEGRLQPVYTGNDAAFDEKEKGVAAWVFHNKQPAGFETHTLSASRWHHVPLVVGGESLGVLAIAPHGSRSFGKERQRLLHAYVNVISLAILNSPVMPLADFLPQ